MVVRLVDRYVGWLLDHSVDYSVDGFVRWLVDSWLIDPFFSLVARLLLFFPFVGRPTGSSVHSYSSIGPFVHRSAEWLVDLFVCWWIRLWIGLFVGQSVGWRSCWWTHRLIDSAIDWSVTGSCSVRLSASPFRWWLLSSGYSIGLAVLVLVALLVLLQFLQ